MHVPAPLDMFLGVKKQKNRICNLFQPTRRGKTYDKGCGLCKLHPLLLERRAILDAIAIRNIRYAKTKLEKGKLSPCKGVLHNRPEFC